MRVFTQTDKLINLCSGATFTSTSASWWSYDSSHLLIRARCTCGSHCRSMPYVLEATCSNADKLHDLEFADTLPVYVLHGEHKEKLLASVMHLAIANKFLNHKNISLSWLKERNRLSAVLWFKMTNNLVPLSIYG